jgi:hypothetical protein
MTLAYPGGISTIPASKHAYFNMVSDRAIEEYLPPSAMANATCQDLTKRSGGLAGYEFRLGSGHYPHLKLRVQLVDCHAQKLWVYSVDTHDGFHHATQFLNDEEAAAWRTLVDHNRALKHQIDEALGKAGFITPVRLLRIDLTAPATV